ncbi:hypothetical protein ACFO4P_00500 [Epilithonimonas pallida]|uniref:YD repeat-containing protein n=1 Tax=Epilithonimonas pallida TaxID=373671 RepID=A0ABY1RA07_9FLAO|nr:hypothetical protein [Epilithonimonas pallida]SMP97458.1 YD repeat-containing protein [Epilithonimonas pallida]
MRKIIKLIFALLLANEFSGQNTSYKPDVDVYPKTPDAASLSKAIDIPPGSYTGVADFTIPIYTIDVAGEKIPIQLQYTTTGVKVAEIASRVGLGWALNTGPHLSQQIMGRMDKRPEKPLLNNSIDIPEPCLKGPVYPTTDPCGIALSAVGIRSFANEFTYDQLPDIYSYSLLNGGGQFIMDSNGLNGIPRPYNMTKIKPIIINGQRIDAMEMSDDKGVYYYFRNDHNMGIENTSSCDPKVIPIDIDYQPNYKIEKIKFPNNEEIIYTYGKSIGAAYVTSITEQDEISKYWVPYVGSFNPLVLPPDRCVNQTQLREQALSRINFSQGKVLFYYNNDTEGFTAPRQDLLGDVYLTRVIVKDNNDHVIKDLSLMYDYFITSDPVPEIYENYSFANGPDMYKRLKLINVRDNLANGEYGFSYYGEEENQTLPNRLSFSQDFWGVYNGKLNTAPIPTVKTRAILDERKRVYLGADKQPDFNYGVIGNLKKIKYPTGGYTQITYEADNYKLFEDVGPVYGYEIRESEEANLYMPYLEFEILNNSGLPIYNQGIILYDSKCAENSPTPVTWSTPQWELWKKNSSGSQFTRVGQGAVCTTPVKFPINREDTPGIYRLNVYERSTDGAPIPPTGTRTITAKYSWVNEYVITDSDIRKTGNIRVKQIENNSIDNGKIIRKYSYIDPNTGQTSGINHGEEQFVAIKYQEFDLPFPPPAISGKRYMQYQSRINNPGWQINTVRGKAVAYGYVQEVFESSLNPVTNYKKETLYNNDPGTTLYEPWGKINVTWPLQPLDRGLLQQENLYDSNGNTVRKTEYKYDYDNYFNKNTSLNQNQGFTSGTIANGLDIQVKMVSRFNGNMGLSESYYFNYAEFGIGNIWIKNVKTTTTDYINNQPTTVTEKVTGYSNPPIHTFPVSETLKNGNGDILNSQHYKYADDIPNPYLQSKNMIGIPLQTEVKSNGVTTVSKIETQYPVSQNEANTKTSGLPLPVSVSSLDLKSGTMSAEMLYKKYDLKGNILQYILKPDANGNGIPVSVIWGYNQIFPIAKIEGATYDNLQNIQSVISAIAASDSDAAAAPGNDESALLAELDKLRKDPLLSNYQITTYTYDPLVGVRSITAPGGMREFYSYDTSGRLKEVKDANGILLKKNEYHYKP